MAETTFRDALRPSAHRGVEGHELDFQPVPPDRLQPASRFAANFAGEHVAGTEFVIGALFVAAGATAADVVVGLIVGNTLAVLTWTLLTAPIAVDTRLSLYAYLEKIARPGFLKIYSVVNGVMFLGLAGSMITVSASAVRVLYNGTSRAPIPAQTGLLPTDVRFVAIALAVGAVVVTLAVLGFKRLAQFAAAVAPWMICMFLVGAIALYPRLAIEAGLELPALSLRELWRVLSTEVYPAQAKTGPFWAIDNEASNVWSIAAFAWVCNLAMHGSLGDMTLLRFAKRRSYGWFSALGMFIGHFGAWVCAGIMGAGAALLLERGIERLDSGDVATQALGWVGVLVVVIAGWTTSNPTLYRAGLAFQSLHPRWNRSVVTLIVGVLTMIVACSPFVFSQLLSYVGWMGLVLSPVGAVVVAEHWLFPALGLHRYWASYRKRPLNLAAVGAWSAAIALILVLYFGVGIHQFFLLLPAWMTATLVYVLLARASGAAADDPETLAAKVEHEAEIAERQRAERDYLAAGGRIDATSERSQPERAAVVVAWGALAATLVLALGLLTSTEEAYYPALDRFYSALAITTGAYLLAIVVAVLSRRGKASDLSTKAPS